jgi:hypothetical protein
MNWYKRSQVKPFNPGGHVMRANDEDEIKDAEDDNLLEAECEQCGELKKLEKNSYCKECSLTVDSE